METAAKSEIGDDIEIRQDATTPIREPDQIENRLAPIKKELAQLNESFAPAKNGSDATACQRVGKVCLVFYSGTLDKHIKGFEPLREYVEQYLSLGGSIKVCSPCNEFYCSNALDNAPLIEGSEMYGLTHVVDLALNASVITLCPSQP